MSLVVAVIGDNTAARGLASTVLHPLTASSFVGNINAKSRQWLVDELLADGVEFSLFWAEGDEVKAVTHGAWMDRTVVDVDGQPFVMVPKNTRRDRKFRRRIKGLLSEELTP